MTEEAHPKPRRQSAEGTGSPASAPPPGGRSPRSSALRRHAPTESAENAENKVMRDDTVELRIPAEGAYLSILRTATAGLAARLDFTLDEIDDLRIAVDEASALLLTDAAPDADLTCLYTLLPDLLVIRVSTTSQTGRLPGQQTFAWTVLSALAGEVHAESGTNGIVAIVLRKRRGGAR